MQNILRNNRKYPLNGDPRKNQECKGQGVYGQGVRMGEKNQMGHR